MNQVSIEVAQSEIDGWLKFRRVNDRRKLEMESQVETLVNAVCDGALIVKEDNSLELTLIEPLGDNSKRVLTFKPRIQVRDVQPALRSLKSGDGDGRIMAYLSALTGESMGILGLMDSSDHSICASIVVFFL
jgi:hypothetical protein